MHTAQKKYIEKIQKRHPKYFDDVFVLDVGSLDVNGNNRYAFTNSLYFGVDILEGKNVDAVMPIHLFAQQYNSKYDVVICTEMLEHDPYWKKSISAMYNLLKQDGLLLITCATTGRKKHMTEYYKNISSDMFLSAIKGMDFKEKSLSINESHKDLYFYGIKNKKK